MRSRIVGSAGMTTAPDHGGWGDGSPLRPLPTDVHDRRSRPARPGRPHRPPRRGRARPGPRRRPPAAAGPAGPRATFTELLIGAAVTRGGHVTDAILAVGLSRSWTTYHWLLERGRWAWLPV